MSVHHTIVELGRTVLVIVKFAVLLPRELLAIAFAPTSRHSAHIWEL